jgi:hypothetical protein
MEIIGNISPFKDLPPSWPARNPHDNDNAPPFAEQGLARPQVKLAGMYDHDIDMPDGSIKACEWYLLAVQGLRGAQLQNAQSAYQRAAKGLVPAQAAEVMRFVQGWKPKITPNMMSAHATEAGRRL